MNTCGAGVLPDNVGSMHAVVLAGPFVLQVRDCALLNEITMVMLYYLLS
jgi:hypothetical protein